MKRREKLCLHCRQLLPTKAFQSNGDKLRPECRLCRRVRRSELREGSPRAKHSTLAGSRA